MEERCLSRILQNHKIIIGKLDKSKEEIEREFGNVENYIDQFTAYTRTKLDEGYNSIWFLASDKHNFKLALSISKSLQNERPLKETDANGYYGTYLLRLEHKDAVKRLKETCKSCEERNECKLPWKYKKDSE